MSDVFGTHSLEEDFGPAGSIDNFGPPEQKYTSEVSDYDGTKFLVAYEERQYQPLSTYDKHQEALFCEAANRIDTVLQPIRDLPRVCRDLEDEVAEGKIQEILAEETFEQLKERINTVYGSAWYDISPKYVASKLEDFIHYCQGERSRLFTAKALFEMRRGNADMAGWLTKEVTDYGHKLELFEKAIDGYVNKEPNEAACLAILMELDKLRQEAEDGGRQDLLVDYLLTEIRCGFGVAYQNTRDIGDLIKDANTSTDTTNILDRLEQALRKHALDLLSQGYPEGALETATLGSKDLYAEVNAHVQVSDWQKNPHNIPQLSRKEAKQLKWRRQDFNQPRDTSRFGELLTLGADALRYPDRLSDQDRRKVVAALRERSTERDTRGVVAGIYCQALCERYPELKVQSIDPSSAERLQQQEEEYADTINRGVTDDNIIDVFIVASKLALKKESQPEIGQNIYIEQLAELELIDAEWEKRRPMVMRDTVDQSRFRTEFNTRLSDVYEKVEKLRYPTQRYRLLQALVVMQKKHDDSKDSSISEQKRALTEAAQKCLTNPIARLSISEEEIREQCGALGIDVEA